MYVCMHVCMYVCMCVYVYMYGTTQFKLYTRVHVRTRFIQIKVYNVECIFVARGFVMCTRAIKQLWDTRHAPHEQTHHEHTFS